MVFAYAAKIPKRWRIFIVTIVALVVFSQLWAFSGPSLEPLSVNVMPPVANPNQKLNSVDQNHNPVDQQSNKAMPAPPKQSILLGFGGFLSKLPQLQHKFGPEPKAYTRLRERRREAVKKSFLHGWQGYKTYALGHDELKPLSNKPNDPFGGWGATMVDALSTLLVMDLTTEFQNVMPRISKINFKVDDDISVFESIIRYLGGFLSAYELSERKQDVLIQKAEKLAIELLPAFDTPSGLPHHLWNPVQNRPNNHETLIAEVGSIQLEFMMLSQLTGNPIYGQKAQAITDFLDNMGYEHGIYIQGLYPTALDTHRGIFKDETTTFGAMGDSAFEYFLKEYLLMDGTVPQYGRMYTQSIKSMKRHMLRQVPGYDMLMLVPYDTRRNTPKSSMDHLTCFVPGMLAMGSKTFNEPEDLEIAKGLLETCVYMYRTTKTGLSPENWVVPKTEVYNPLTFNKSREELSNLRDWWYEEGKINPLIQKKLDKLAEEEGNEIEQQTPVEEQPEYFVDYQLPPVRERPESLFFGDKRYILRPETVESLFILYRITGDQKYQEYGWEIYQAIEKWCKTPSAYATIRNVDRSKEDGNESDFNQIDSMESFLFAETFKYLYLLFSPPELMSLDKFIFNTEAHPFVRKQWNWDRIFKKKI